MNINELPDCNPITSFDVHSVCTSEITISWIKHNMRIFNVSTITDVIPKLKVVENLFDILM